MKASWVDSRIASSDLYWSQTDPRATGALAGDAYTVTLPAGLVPDCSGMMNIISPARLFAAALVPVPMHLDAATTINLHIEFDVPDVGRSGEVTLDLSARSGRFKPGHTSSIPVSPQIVDPVGASNPAAQWKASSIFTGAGFNGAQNMGAGHHVWDVAVPFQMDPLQIGLSFELALGFQWGPDTLAALAAEQRVTATVTATVEGGTLEPAAAAADVFYRDPADQKFKPLTTLMVNGFPATGGLDPATAEIRYRDHALTAGTAAVGTVPGGYQQPDVASAPGGTVTAVAGGMRYQMNTGPTPANDFKASAEVLLTDVPIIHADDRLYTVLAHFDRATWNANGGMWSMNFQLVSDGSQFGITIATGPNPGSAATGDIKSDNVSGATLKALVEGGRLRLRASIGVSVFSGSAKPFECDVTVTGITIKAQEIVAP